MLSLIEWIKAQCSNNFKWLVHTEIGNVDLLSSSVTTETEKCSSLLLSPLEGFLLVGSLAVKMCDFFSPFLFSFIFYHAPFAISLFFSLPLCIICYYFFQSVLTMALLTFTFFHLLSLFFFSLPLSTFSFPHLKVKWTQSNLVYQLSDSTDVAVRKKKKIDSPFFNNNI